MRVLVTGASGFLGSRICRALSLHGHAVRAMVRPTSSRLALDGLAVEVVLGDLMDPPSLEAAAHAQEVIFHCAGEVTRWKKPEHMIASHVAGTRHVLSAALKAGVGRFVHTSSVAALGVPDRDPGPDGADAPLLDETHAWNTSARIWPYGFAKDRAEAEVLQAVKAGLPAVIVNPSVIFGPGDVYRYRASIVGRLLSGRLPPLGASGGLNAIHIDDVVAGHVAALERGKPGRRYILGAENMTHHALLAMTARILGRPGPRLDMPPFPLRALGGAAIALSRWVPLPNWLSLFPLAGVHFYYDTSRATNELGFEPGHSVADGIQQAVAWFKANEASLP